VALHCELPQGDRVGTRTGEPAGCGVPFPRGMLPSTGSLILFDGNLNRVPLQARAVDRWSDGSVRWALLDWLASATGDRSTYSLGADESLTASEDAGAPTVDIAEHEGSVEVRTAAACFRLRPGGAFPFDQVTVGGAQALDTDRCGLFVRDGSGAEYQAQIDRVEVREVGPVRVAVELTGALGGEEAPPLAALSARLHFYRCQSTVRMELTITNPRRAAHPGNVWELGDAGSIYLQDLALTLALPAGAGRVRTRCWPEPGLPYQDDDEFELYQDSSGGENWRSSNHVNRNGTVPLAFRGYRLRCGQEEIAGLRASPIVTVERHIRTLALAPHYFWQDFPKALEVSGGAVTLRLFPGQSRDVHELQGGERKTHLLTLALTDDGITDEPLAWCRAPLLARAEPAWHAVAQAVPDLLPRSEDPHAAYLKLVDQAIEGDTSFESKREVVDEYGWRHFGDLWADHEAVKHGGAEPLISHYNNQYDAVEGCALQFLRSGDRRWHELMEAMARHVTDIDVYHSSEDKSAYNQGYFWHTTHYTDAGQSTHRTYPAAEGVSGGGPSGGHLYTTGLMMHYLLTGCERSRQTVTELGRYVIDADDGTRSIFRFVDHGPTGHVTLSDTDYHGAGRGSANSLNALLDAHRLTGKACFLDKAEEIIARCVHPADDLEALDLLDSEHRWFYMMFLQSLAKYLDYKAECGAVDGNYAYAQAALLHYSLWALEHEVPYLSRPEGLEFPTETWAAQDMRKSEVFQLAARHAGEKDRRRLQERAAFFFDYSLTTLLSMPTRSLCRPVALMLTSGYRQAYFERHAGEAMPQPADVGVDFGAPRPFVTQKQRVKRKLLVGAAAMLAALAGLVGVWVMG